MKINYQKETKSNFQLQRSSQLEKVLNDVFTKSSFVFKDKQIFVNVIYVDLSKVDKDNFYKSFNKKYGNDKYNLNNYPAVILFSEGKIREIVSKEKKNKLTIDQIEQLFDEYEVDNTND